jgi:short-subunit dehydrogenase
VITSSSLSLLALPPPQITGCSSGLGEALARRMHADGFEVWATARRVSALDSLAALGIHCATMDVTDDASVKTAVSGLLQATGGRLDVLVNNAGMSKVGPLLEQPLAEVQSVLDTNLIGVLRVTQAAVPAMADARRGLVVNIGSIVSQLSTPWAGAYSASKAALLALTDTLRLELAPFGVGVTYVTAGSIASAFGDNAAAGSSTERYSAGTGSRYAPWQESVRQRAQMSQAPGAMPADAVAAQVDAVINKAMARDPPAPPTWFFAGGKAWVFWSLGLAQKVLGWPTNSILAKRFNLKALLPLSQ